MVSPSSSRSRLQREAGDRLDPAPSSSGSGRCGRARAPAWTSCARIAVATPPLRAGPDPDVAPHLVAGSLPEVPESEGLARGAEDEQRVAGACALPKAPEPVLDGARAIEVPRRAFVEDVGDEPGVLECRFPDDHRAPGISIVRGCAPAYASRACSPAYWSPRHGASAKAAAVGAVDRLLRSRRGCPPARTMRPGWASATCSARVSCAARAERPRLDTDGNRRGCVCRARASSRGAGRPV